MATSPPPVSIVLPAYNHEAFIAESVDSALAQSFGDFELIVIDDGSTDRTAEIVAGYTDPRIRFLRQDNAGSHVTINRGLELARGRYLAILNSDDRYAPRRLERLVAVAQGRADRPIFAVTGVRLIDAAGTPVTDPSHPWLRMYSQILAAWEAEPDPASALLWGNFTISTSNFFADRNLLRSVGPFRSYRYVLDWEYALRVALHRPEAFVFLADEMLLDYRLHGGNTILGGAIRNHIEAAHMLRCGMVERFGDSIERPLRRVRYLERFLRKKETSTREHALKLISAEVETLRGQLRQQRDELQAQLHAEQRTFTQQRAQLEARLALAESSLQEIWQSASWRLTRPVRWAGRQVSRLRRRAISALKTRGIGGPALPRRALAVLRTEGVAGVMRRLRHRLVPPVPHGEAAAQAGSGRLTTAYQRWLDAEARELASLRQGLDALLQALPTRPCFSIVAPVFDTDPAMLERMFASVRAQLYPDWELCVCDDASRREDTRAVIAAQTGSERRISVRTLQENRHIVGASNAAIDMAGGDYVVFLDHDDELAPHALLCLAQALAADPSLDVLYSDEDKLDEKGMRCLPFFKPDWSPTLITVQNYAGHLLCVRRSLLQECGGLRPGTEGSQDYDLVLRLSERTSRIHHIPRVLYHWRLHGGSTAINTESKPYAHETGRKALEAHLRRRYGEQLDRVEDGEFLFTYDARYRLPESLSASIIIPTRDKAELLAACVGSILQKSTWQHFEILILDNGSREAATLAWFKRLTAQDKRIRVLPAPIPFNWSRLNNLGAAQAAGNVLIFLNNDTKVISPDWLERLIEQALLTDVASVGAQLRYEDGTIQHAGVVVGVGGWADHVYKGERPAHLPGPFVSNTLSRNVLANTGACVAIEGRKFFELGEFDEAFEICGSDVELGIRAHKSGLQNVYLSTVRLYHLESKSRSSFVPEGDFAQSELKYVPYRLGGDPYYNPNLSLDTTTPLPRYPGANA